MIEALKPILREPIWTSDKIYLDNWSLVHFIVGYWLYSKFKLKPVIAVSLIVVYELIEPYFVFFRPETPIDIFWDIVIGISGYYMARGKR